MMMCESYHTYVTLSVISEEGYGVRSVVV